MEGLIKRTFVFAALLVGTGSYFMATRGKEPPAITEQWMESQLPQEVDGYTYEKSEDNPQQSYRMGQSSYDILQPYGIVCRIYTKGQDRFDAVVISSRSKDSFHEPRVCFGGSGLILENQREVTIKTQTRGEVPITITTLFGRGARQPAAFFYKGPRGFTGVPNRLKLQIFKDELLKGEAPIGHFYRFIATHPGATEDELKEFVAKYIDASNESSGGFY